MAAEAADAVSKEAEPTAAESAAELAPEPEPVPVAAELPGETETVAVAAEEAAPAADGEAAPEAEQNPQLPRVIMEPGAPFVGLVHNDGGRGGLVVLTHHPKRVQKTKPVIAEASRSGPTACC